MNTLRGVLLVSVLLAGCIDAPAGMVGIESTHGNPGWGVRSGTVDDSAREVQNLRKAHIVTGDHHLEYRWRRPADTVGLIGYEYQIHDKPGGHNRWEHTGSVPDGEFRPCRTQPDRHQRNRHQHAKCTHGLVNEYDSLTWVRLYDFRVRAVYADSSRGPVAEVLDARPRKPRDNTGGSGRPGSSGGSGGSGQGGGGSGAGGTCADFEVQVRVAYLGDVIPYSGECHGAWTGGTVGVLRDNTGALACDDRSCVSIVAPGPNKAPHFVGYEGRSGLWQNYGGTTQHARLGTFTLGGTGCVGLPATAGGNGSTSVSLSGGPSWLSASGGGLCATAPAENLGNHEFDVCVDDSAPPYGSTCYFAGVEVTSP